jgi:GTP diphosphokinase / guanosine-3',5'-bis(diphosphate) 3'-diphosphatase
LPEGATPLDFAFAVHSDVGLRALGAKVNGRMMPLDTRLENRDVVEIVTRREAAPSRDWLGSVVTSHAKSRLRTWFRSASREANVARGRTELEEALQAWGVMRIEDLPKRAVADALDGLHIRSMEDLLAQVGEGAYSASQMIRRLLPDAAKPAGVRVVKRPETTGRVLTEGDQLPHTLAPCCNPVFPRPLIGYITRGKGVTVHALGCRNVPMDVERYVTCRWETKVEETERLLCRLEVRAVNRIGLILDITAKIAAQKLNIAGMATRQVDVPGDAVGETMVSFGLEVQDLFVLASMIRKLERIPGVMQVRRVE